MNAYHSLVSMAVHVGTRLDPSIVSVLSASVESAVRQVKSDQHLIVFHAKIQCTHM